MVGPKGLAESGWELFDGVEGSERKLLHAIVREQGNAQAGYVEDSKIAEIAYLSIEEVRDCLETLEGKECVQRSVGVGGHSAYITAKGRQELRRSPIVGDDRDESAPKTHQGRPQGPSVIRCRGQRLLPRIASRSSSWRWASRKHPFLEDPDRGDGPRQDLFRGGDLRPERFGKSSLVKAGMLPRLADSVIRIYVEATANDTEARLLRELRKHVPNLPTDLALPESVRALQEGQFDQRSKKVLVVIDQFEQWLHAKRLEEAPELVQALGHCDGRRVQAIVMVRVDFWMALTRFMGKLEIELHQGQNFVAVDLFDQDHARKVLTLFGQAFGKVPDISTISRKNNEHSSIKRLPGSP